MEPTGVQAFLKRKNVNITVQTYLIDALGAMAFGLFASLLIGTIRTNFLLHRRLLLYKESLLLL